MEERIAILPAAHSDHHAIARGEEAIALRRRLHRGIKLLLDAPELVHEPDSAANLKRSKRKTAAFTEGEFSAA